MSELAILRPPIQQMRSIHFWRSARKAAGRPWGRSMTMVSIHGLSASPLRMTGLHCPTVMIATRTEGIWTKTRLERRLCLFLDQLVEPLRPGPHARIEILKSSNPQIKRLSPSEPATNATAPSR
jgi:hypothetical protein